MYPCLLSDAKIRNAKATDKPRKIFDRDGLFLHVSARKGGGTHKRWRFKFYYGGNEKLMSFEIYPR